ncbi:MAG: hypothetical protein Kow0037_00680 [Calditrichia bacterium]
MKQAVIVKRKQSVEKLRRLSRMEAEVFKNQLGYVVVGKWEEEDLRGYTVKPEKEIANLRNMDAAL